jgi:hypothetical protein
MSYDGGVRQQFSIAFRARLIGGQKRTSDESSEVEWLTLKQIEDLDLHPSMRLRLQPRPQRAAAAIHRVDPTEHGREQQQPAAQTPTATPPAARDLPV